MHQPSIGRTGGNADTSVRIHLPDERLRSFATFYYFVRCDGELEDFLYPEWGNVRFALRGSWSVEAIGTRAKIPAHGALFGHTDRAAKVVTRDGVTAGFGLTPLGWERLFRSPASLLANKVVDLGDRLGTNGEALHAELCRHDADEQSVALFNRLLLDRLALARPNTPMAIRVDAALRERPADVATFAQLAGVSTRSLLAGCRRVFGFTPKRLLRRQRFLDTLGRIRITDNPVFNDLRDPAYFDQSHFTHEFREFMGLSPREYVSAPRPLMGQAALVQMQAGIPLSFKLPPPPDAP